VNKVNVEKLTIRDYPWLMDAVFEILCLKNVLKNVLKNIGMITRMILKNVLKKRSLYKNSRFLCNNDMHIYYNRMNQNYVAVGFHLKKISHL